jgi:hypothetical protein
LDFADRSVSDVTGCLEYVDSSKPMSDFVRQHSKKVFEFDAEVWSLQQSNSILINSVGCWIWVGVDAESVTIPPVGTHGMETRSHGRKTLYPYGNAHIGNASGHEFSSNREDGLYCASNWRNLIVWFPCFLLLQGQSVVVTTLVDATEFKPVYR